MLKKFANDYEKLQLKADDGIRLARKAKEVRERAEQEQAFARAKTLTLSPHSARLLRHIPIAISPVKLKRSMRGSLHATSHRP